MKYRGLFGSKKEDFEKFVDEVSVHLTLDSAFAST